MTQLFSCNVERIEHGLKVNLQSDMLQTMFTNESEIYDMTRNKWEYHTEHTNLKYYTPLSDIRVFYNDNEFINYNYNMRIEILPLVSSGDVSKGITFVVRSIVPDILYPRIRAKIRNSLMELCSLHVAYMKNKMSYNDTTKESSD